MNKVNSPEDTNEQVSTMSLPRHVAIIMDGNGRWAKQRNLPRVAGHRAGINSIRKVIKQCCEKNISVLTLFAFGNENWRRPKNEINYLLDLFILVLRDELDKLHEQNIKLQVIGDRYRFSKKIQKYIQRAEELTHDNTGLLLNIAASYSGQWDILQATQSIAQEVLAGQLLPSEITSEYFTKKLTTGNAVPPDLFIRTSGELRLSNFLLWQLAYTELYFTDVYWPDFDEDDFNQALLSYAKRQRRFGFITEQLQAEGDIYA